MAIKRKRSRTPVTRSVKSRRRVSKKRPNTVRVLQRQISNITRSIETKEAAHRITNVHMQHNNVTVFNNSAGTVFNPFEIGAGVTDDMGRGGTHIGDKIQVKSMLFKFFIEGELSRSKVYFRFMLIKMAKGDTLTRATLFKGVVDNKMIDQLNTERYTVVAQKILNVSPPNYAPSGVISLPATGHATGSVPGITGTKILTMYVSGKKFGRDGNVTYENASTTQIKFYDYRLVCVAYDWYGTPQDVNNVGFVNDGFVKVYYKDA